MRAVLRPFGLALALMATAASTPLPDAASVAKRIAAHGAPLVDPLPDGSARVTFVWRGAATRSVLLDWPAWGAARDDTPFWRLSGSDLWVKTLVLPRGTRMAYRLVPDLPPGERADGTAFRTAGRPDPLNPRRWLEGKDAASVLDLSARPSLWLRPGRAVAAGRIETAQFASAILGNTRKLTFYRPAHGDPRWLLIVFDGDSYLQKIRTPAILDAMIAARAIPPVAAVFVSNPDGLARRRELACYPPLAAFLADELLPWIGRHMALPPREQRILAGSSLGGLAGTCAAIDRPAAFGAVLSQSGSYWWTPTPGTPRYAPDDETRANWVARRIAAGPNLPLRFYLSAGQLEGVPGDGGIGDTNRMLRDVLRSGGYRVTLAEVPGGHDHFSWRADLPEGLIALTRPLTPRRFVAKEPG